MHDKEIRFEKKKKKIETRQIMGRFEKVFYLINAKENKEAIKLARSKMINIFLKDDEKFK